MESVMECCESEGPSSSCPPVHANLEEEENDMLLYLWQRAAFMDSGQGVPREMADSLRIRVAQLGSYHTKMRQAGRDSFGTEQLLKTYLDRYSRVMDERDESKGMNNFNSSVQALLAGKGKGQRNWKSNLQLDMFKDMPGFKAVMEEAETYSKNPSLERGIPFPVSTKSSSSPHTSPPSHISPAIPPPNTSSVPPPRISSALSRTSSATPLSHTLSAPPPSHIVPPSKHQKASPENSKFPHTPRRGLFQYAQPLTGGAKPTPGTSQNPSSAPYKGRSFARETRTTSARMHQPPLKRSRDAMSGGVEGFDEYSEVDDRLHTFSTARDEYARQQQQQQQQRKYGGGYGNGGPSSSPPYGSSKKVLGTRRGASGHFVPPVRVDSDGGHGNCVAEIQSRILKGKGGGGGVSTSQCLPPELEGDERLRNIEPRMVELIMNEIMDCSAPVQWDDIAGLDFAKATIKEIVVWPMMRPDLFTGLRGPPKGILLFGPPGTGKTLIGKCIASQVEATFFNISASSLTSKWIGEGEKMVRALFAVARCFQPAVVFMDEIDSLLTQRSDTEHESSRRIKTEFLVQLDGATTNEADRLLVIGATNRPQEIDEAARRRLVKRLYIPLPDAPARKQIVLNLMKQQPFHLAEDEMELVCTRTEGYSGADMANLCREAAYGPVRETASNIQHISVDDIRKVLYKDFEAALLAIKPSVSEKDLDLYIGWNRQFGCGGNS